MLLTIRPSLVVRRLGPLLALAACACTSSTHASTPPPPPQGAPSLLLYELAGDLLAVPLAGGTAIPLASTGDYESFVALAGDRVIFKDASQPSSAGVLCSVRIDGTDRITLVGSSTDEALFGVLDGRAVIGRAFGAASALLDEVLSVPVAGGEPTVLDQATSVDAPVDVEIRSGILFDEGPGGVSSVKADGTGRVSLLGVAGRVADVSSSHVALIGHSDGHAYTVGLDGAGAHDSGHAPLGTFGQVLGRSTGSGRFAGDDFVFAELTIDSTTSSPTSTIWSMASGSGTVSWVDTIPDMQLFNPVDSTGTRVAFTGITGADVATVLLADASATGHVDLGQGGRDTSYAGQLLGRLLVQDTSGTLVSYAPDGSDAVTLGSGVSFGLSSTSFSYEGAFVQRPVVAIAGRLLIRLTVDGESQLQSMNPDGTGVVTINQGPGAPSVVAVIGATVVYSRASDSQSLLDAVEIDGSGHHVVLESAAGATLVLVAGDILVLERSTITSTNLSAVPLAGGAETPLTSGEGHKRAVAAY